MEEQEEQQKQNNDYLYSKFVNSLKSKTTKFFYVRRVKYFIDFLGLTSNEYSKLVDQKKDRKAIENDIISFLIYLRKDRKISYRSDSYYLDALKKFYDVNSDYDFKWKLIKSYLGDDDDEDDDNESKIEEDRPYTKKEIQTMVCRNKQNRFTKR
jgi:hypothetical protein